MIEKRDVRGMGRTIHTGASAVHHFCFGRYQAPDRLSWGRLRVLNRIDLEPGGRRDVYPLGGMHVVLLVEAGELQAQFGDRKQTIRRGEVAVITMGLGGDYGFSSSGGERTVFTELWFEGVSRRRPRLAHRKVSAEQPVIASCFLEDRPIVSLTSPGRVSLWNLEEGASLALHPQRGHAYVFLVSGDATMAGIICTAGDALASRGETELSIVASTASCILSVESLDGPDPH